MPSTRIPADTQNSIDPCFSLRPLRPSANPVLTYAFPCSLAPLLPCQCSNPYNRIPLHNTHQQATLTLMIKSFKHKGLEKFFTTGSKAGIQAAHATRLEERLQALHTATVIDDMDIPGWRLHPLKGDRDGLWSITVSGNWRIVFAFMDGHAHIVNYEDYH